MSSLGKEDIKLQIKKTFLNVLSEFELLTIPS